MACCRTLLYQRPRLPSCSLSSFKWRNYSSNESTNNNETVKETEVDTKEAKHAQIKKDIPFDIKKNPVKRDILFDIRKSPRVDLSKATGITIKHSKRESEHSMLIKHCLDENPTKEGLIKAVDIYINKNKIRRGHMEFIATAMKFIEPYGLEKEPEVYEKLMDVFPRDRFVNRSLFDAILPKAHPQMFLALDLLTKMEWQTMIPSVLMHDVVYEIFGRASLPLQKIYRMWFWFEEFKDINPYRLDEKVYEDRMDIIKAAIDRILGNNDGTKIIEISAPIEEENIINYDHFIVSSQTLLQQKYISYCMPSTSIYIEGPTHIWINHKLEQYFIMKTGQGELLSSTDIKIDADEEREGVVIGVCFATKPYNETLQRWLKYMQEGNPALKDLRVIFDVINEETGEEIKVIASG